MRYIFARFTVILSVFLFVGSVYAQQVTSEDYARAEGFLRGYTAQLVFKSEVNPTWISTS